MAEGESVIHLEQDLKRILGIKSNIATPVSTESKICNGPDLGTPGEATNTTTSKQSQKQHKRRGNRKHAEDFNSHNEASSSSAKTEDVEKRTENAMANKAVHNQVKEKKSVANKMSPKQQVNLDETDRQPASDHPHYFKFDGYKKPKPASQLGTKVYSRNGPSNNGEIPQNWRQPARESTSKLKNPAAEQEKKTAILLENGAAASVKDSSHEGTAKAKTRVRNRVKKDTQKKEPGETPVPSSSVVVPKNLLESDDAKAGPSNGDMKESFVLSKEENKIAQPVLQKGENHQEQTQVLTASQVEEEEVVRITIPPQPPQQKRQRNVKKETNTEKSDPEKKEGDDDDDSSSNSSSSTEEEKTPRPEREILPLVFNIRKTELESFRRRGVLTLKHISPKFPRAIFHCRLCSFHISSIPEVYRHMKDDRHVRLQNQERSKQTAALMPLPTPEIMEGVGQFILNIYHCSGLTKEALEIRYATIGILKSMIEIAFPGFSIRPYGSFFTGVFTHQICFLKSIAN